MGGWGWQGYPDFRNIPTKWWLSLSLQIGGISLTTSASGVRLTPKSFLLRFYPADRLRNKRKPQILSPPSLVLASYRGGARSSNRGGASRVTRSSWYIADGEAHCSLKEAAGDGARPPSLPVSLTQASQLASMAFRPLRCGVRMVLGRGAAGRLNRSETGTRRRQLEDATS